MTEINLAQLDIAELNGLIGKAQSEMASRETRKRRDLRTELDRRLRAEGYQLADIFPEATDGPRRQKRPVKFRNPQDPEQSWSGVGRLPKWVQEVLDERTIDLKTFKEIPMYQIT